MQNHKLIVGFVLNPYAGLGGPAGLKGSDIDALQRQADNGELALTAPARCEVFWRTLNRLALSNQHQNSLSLNIVAAPGQLGASWLRLWDISHRVVDISVSIPSTARDTQNAVMALCEDGIDLLLFAGGDGTARDVHDAISQATLVLGIPAGVKMHSGVYAINPQCAAELVARMASGHLIASNYQEVRDIDEEDFRKGMVRARHYGDMRVPAAAEFVQAVKQGGIENEALVILDIAQQLREDLPDNAMIIWAPGSTTLGVLAEFGHVGTLLGVDALLSSGELVVDVNASMLEALVDNHTGPVVIVVTAIGGQGHILGRGNQQITPKVLRRCSKNNLFVIASKNKLQSLGGRPLILDSGDSQLDQEWRGWIDITAGYNDKVVYRLSDGY